MAKKRSRRRPTDDNCPLLDMLLEDWALPDQPVDEPLMSADRDLTPLPSSPGTFVDPCQSRRTLH